MMNRLIRACMTATFAFGLAFVASTFVDDTAEAQRSGRPAVRVTASSCAARGSAWVYRGGQCQRRCQSPYYWSESDGRCLSGIVTTYRGHGSCSDWTRTRRNNQTGTPVDPCDYNAPKVRDRGHGYEGGTGYGDAGPSFSSFWEWSLWRSRD